MIRETVAQDGRLRNAQSIMPGVKIALAALAALILLVQAAAHFSATTAGRPYETWDETATFNTARVVNSSEAPLRAYRYGPIDTFMQWTAWALYDTADPIGATTPHIRYGNQAPQSWSDPYLPFARDKTWVGADYPYFRGADDREPIFLSRKIHLITGYLLLLGLGFLAVAAYGLRSVYIIAPLLLFSVAPEQYHQLTQSLPNAIAAILAFGCVLSALIFCDQRRARWLVSSAVFLALGLNFKIDMIIIAGAPALALIVSVFLTGWRFALTAGLKSIAAFSAVFVATRPFFLVEPLQEMRVNYHVVTGAGGAEGIVLDSIGSNISMLSKFLSGSLLWSGAPSWPGLALCLVIFGGIAVMAVMWRKSMAWLLIGLLVSATAWAAILTKGSNIADRYFLNGYSALAATAAMALVLLLRGDARRKRVANAILALTFLAYGGQVAARSVDSLQVHSSHAGLGGFDPAHNRNRASFAAIELVKQGHFKPIVIVDQHSYTDLRILRLHGLDARYANMDNLDQAIASLPQPGRYLMLYSRGTVDKRFGFHRPWMGDWSDELTRRYETYHGRLSTLPTVQRFSGKPQLLTSVAPVEPKDEITLALIER